MLQPAWEDYSTGRTPNPCVRCNRFLKFGKLIEYARSIGAEGIVTGHYARIEADQDGGPLLLKRGRDEDKDQSYFLSGIRREDLESIFFPLGEFTKKEVRNLAAEMELPNADKIESQDACFGIKGEAFSETLRRHFSAEAKPGFFIGPDGRRVGRHEGCHLYTIGQRKGLNVALGRPAYIAAIDTKSGEIRLEVDDSLLLSREMSIADMNWLVPGCEGQTPNCSVQIRYRHKAVPAEVSLEHSPGLFKLRFATPQRAVTPGQAAVLYDGDTVLGGGWIVSAHA